MNKTFLWPAVGAAAVLLVVVAISSSAASLLSDMHGKAPRWWCMTLVAFECILVAAAAPFWAAGSRHLGKACILLGLFLAAGTAVISVSTFTLGISAQGLEGALSSCGRPVLRALGAQVLIFSFAMFLMAITRTAPPSRRWQMQLVATITGFAMLGTVFYSNPIIEAPGASDVRNTVISGVLGVNPLVILTGSLYKYDLLRGGPERLYEYCVIGPYYPFRYFNWFVAAIVSGGLTTAVEIVSVVFRRKHKCISIVR